MGHIVWLASYPKSGNTWFRMFLTNLLNESNEPAHINDIAFSIAKNRTFFDELVGVEASELTTAEIETILPDVYTQMSAEVEEPLFAGANGALKLAQDMSDDYWQQLH